jgi:hypothetical protein
MPSLLFSRGPIFTARVTERHQARLLRLQGLSFGEIRAVLSVAKSTLNGWLKDIELTDAQKRRLLERAATGREKARVRGAWSNRQKRIQRIAETFASARREFLERLADPLFVAGVVLYWAEGSKTGPPFMFANSDPTAIRTMMQWLSAHGSVPKGKIVGRVYVHRLYADCGFERFWEEATGLPASQFRKPVFKPTPHKVKKNPTYMGCCRLVVNSSELFWRLRAWQEELVRYLGISLPSHLVDGVIDGRAEAPHSPGRPEPRPGDPQGGQLPEPPGGPGAHR